MDVLRSPKLFLRDGVHEFEEKREEGKSKLHILCETLSISGKT